LSNRTTEPTIRTACSAPGISDRGVASEEAASHSSTSSGTSISTSNFPRPAGFDPLQRPDTSPYSHLNRTIPREGSKTCRNSTLLISPPRELAALCYGQTTCLSRNSSPISPCGSGTLQAY